jgi:Na+/melibiose symporter-like transporter
MKPVIALLSLLPLLGMLGFLPLVNKVEPYILGLPFVFFWVIVWVILTSVILAIVYKLDPANKEGEVE